MEDPVPPGHHRGGTVSPAPTPAIVAIRPATMADASGIKKLIEESVRGLSSADYTIEIIEAALRSAWGLDTQLLEDGTYYLLSVDDELAACGGWSFRRTLFGSDTMSSRDSSKLQPGKDAARIRAFFVRPSFARLGLGSRLLLHCEQQAKTAGFESLSLGATEPGRRLYRTHGFVESTPVDYDPDGALWRTWPRLIRHFYIRRVRSTRRRPWVDHWRERGFSPAISVCCRTTPIPAERCSSGPS